MARPGRIEDRKDVEEVAADRPSGAIVAGDLPALGLDARQQDERALDPPCDPELALEELRVRRRRSGSLEGGDGVCPIGIDAVQGGHASALEHAGDRILGAGEPDGRCRALLIP